MAQLINDKLPDMDITSVPVYFNHAHGVRIFLVATYMQCASGVTDGSGRIGYIGPEHILRMADGLRLVNVA